MTIIKCDRCGNEIPSGALSYKVSIVDSNGAVLAIPGPDYCGDCKDTLTMAAQDTTITASRLSMLSSAATLKEVPE